MAAGAEEEVKEHAGSYPDRDVDHGPLGGRGRPDAGCHVPLVENGQHKPERDDRHERVDPGRELEDRWHPGAHPKPIHHGIHRHRRAEGGDRRQGAGEYGRVAPGHLDDVPEEPEQGRRRDPEGRDRLGEGDAEVVAFDKRHGGEPEVGTQQHSQPAQREAHDGGQVLDLPRVEQPGDRGPSRKPMTTYSAPPT